MCSSSLKKNLKRKFKDQELTLSSSTGFSWKYLRSLESNRKNCINNVNINSAPLIKPVTLKNSLGTKDMIRILVQEIEYESIHLLNMYLIICYDK